MRVIRTEAGRRVSNLIAAKSMDRAFVGLMGEIMGSIPVGRALDQAKTGAGKVYLPDPKNDPLLVRGVDTKFDKQAQVGGLLVLPTINGTAASTMIQEIISAEEIRLKKPFEGDEALKQLTGKGNENEGDFKGTSYKTAPKVDQTAVYDAVFDRLNRGGCVCMFPEGGSHDRTELLPLKGKDGRIQQQCSVLTITSWCGNYGPWCISSASGLWIEDRTLRNELFPCA